MKKVAGAGALDGAGGGARPWRCHSGHCVQAAVVAAFGICTTSAAHQHHAARKPCSAVAQAPALSMQSGTQTAIRHLSHREEKVTKNCRAPTDTTSHFKQTTPEYHHRLRANHPLRLPSTQIPTTFPHQSTDNLSTWYHLVLGMPYVGGHIQAVSRGSEAAEEGDERVRPCPVVARRVGVEPPRLHSRSSRLREELRTAEALRAAVTPRGACATGRRCACRSATAAPGLPRAALAGGEGGACGFCTCTAGGSGGPGVGASTSASAAFALVRRPPSAAGGGAAARSGIAGGGDGGRTGATCSAGVAGSAPGPASTAVGDVAISRAAWPNEIAESLGEGISAIEESAMYEPPPMRPPRMVTEPDSSSKRTA